MTTSPQLPKRRSIRLPGFDYASQGAYFITIVTKDRRCAFGTIVDDALQATALGVIATEEWAANGSPVAAPFVLMPNHLHAIVVLSAGVNMRLGAIIGRFKLGVLRRARTAGVAPTDGALWQRNYYEHVIRDERDWNAIEAYIDDNPRRWMEDAENPGSLT